VTDIGKRFAGDGDDQRISAFQRFFEDFVSPFP
jgi:hypothetical protein